MSSVDFTQDALDQFRRLNSTRKGPRRAHSSRGRKLYLEILEQRHLLSAPVVSDFSENVSHNTPFAFPTVDFTNAFSDADIGDSLQSLQITLQPTHGTLLLNGSSIATLQVIPLASVTDLTYTPESNYVGSDSFGWNASDGTDFAVTPATVNLTVSNQQPTVSDINKDVGRNSPATFSAAAFGAGFSDPDSGDTVAIVKITSLPTHGTLKLADVLVTVNQEIPAGNLTTLVYQPDAGFTGSDSFSWNGSDGVVYAAGDALVNLSITESAPTAHDIAKSAGTNAITTFASADFTAGFTDPDTGDTLQSVIVTSLPTHGNLLLNGSSVTAAQIIPVAQLANLTYTPTTDYTGADAFGWNASDGAQFGAAAASVNLTVGNLPPVTTNIPFTINRNTVLHFTTASFTAHFTDPNTGDTLHFVTITGLPTYGTLAFNGIPVVTFQQLTAAELAKLTYTPNTNFSGTDTFAWAASDGTAYSNAASNVNLTVNGLAPSVTTVNKATLQDTDLTFVAREFTDAFTEPNVGPILRTIKITSLPLHGTLKLSDVAVTLNQEIPATEIANLKYTPTTSYVGADSFGWNGSDGALYASSASTVKLTVIPTASLTVTGNGNLIPAGTTTTNRTSFTDFGPRSIVVNASIQAFTRTYTITNHTGATVNLTGGASLVQITGAADFTVTTAPASSSLADGASTTFTITFAPQAAGLRAATVNIPNSAGAVFKFAIQGTGLNTTDGFNGLPALQEAQTLVGTGDPSVFGDVLTMNYTGYLPDGTLFDSSLNPGRNPFQFALGGNSVIQGWDPGLIGIKVGEKRTLIIPGAQAYPGGSGTIPAGATLVFEVQCLSIGVPRVAVQVQGNTNLITPQNKIALVSDGTDFGSLSASQNSLTITFNLFSVGYTDPGNTVGAGLSFQSDGVAPHPAQITLGGTNASDFVLNHSSGTGTFTVTFNKPAVAGKRVATITVNTNDPINPALTFTIQATAGAFVDLQPSIGATNFPQTNITSGDGTTLTLPVIIKNNNGNSNTTGTTDIQVYGEDTTTHVQTLITTFVNQNVSGIAPNKTKTINLAVKLPVGFPAGTYKLVAKVNTTHAVTETDLTNNDATTTQSINVLQGLADLTGNLVSTTLPSSVVGGTLLKGNVVVLLKNLGNVPLPSNQTVTLTVIAHNTTTDTDTTLLIKSNQSVKSLKVNGTKSFSLAVNFAAGIPAGPYEIHVQVTPTPVVAESDTANNLIIQTAAAQKLTITAVAPFVNLTGVLGTSTVPASRPANTAITGNLKITVQNFGNVALADGQTVQIQVIAHDVNSSTNIAMSPSAALSVTKLAPNKGLTLTVPVNFVNGLPAGSYVFEAAILPVPDVNEPNTADNVVTVNASGGSIALTVT